VAGLPLKGTYQGYLKTNGSGVSIELKGIKKSPKGNSIASKITDKAVAEVLVDLLAVATPYNVSEYPFNTAPYLISSGVVSGEIVRGMIIDRKLVREEVVELRVTATNEKDLAFLEASLKSSDDAQKNPLLGVQSSLEGYDVQNYQNLIVEYVRWNSRDAKHARRYAEFLNREVGSNINNAFGEGLRLFEVHDPYISRGENYIFVFDPKTQTKSGFDEKTYYNAKDYVSTRALDGFSLDSHTIRCLYESIEEKFGSQ